MTGSANAIRFSGTSASSQGRSSTLWSERGGTGNWSSDMALSVGQPNLRPSPARVASSRTNAHRHVSESSLDSHLMSVPGSPRACYIPKRRSTRPPDRSLISMSDRKRRTAVAGACAAVVATGLIPLTTGQAQAQSPTPQMANAAHVLLISVDGLHQSDLGSYVKTHPSSALARMVAAGISYTHAQTPIPSD